MQIKGNIDILVITESKLDRSFSSQLFFFEGYAMPYRIDRNANGGGILIYIREDIPCRDLAKYSFSNNASSIFEGIFLEINLRKTKWLLFGGYNPMKINIDSYLQTLSSILDKHLPKYDNIILLGDFNAEIVDSSMQQFCEAYHLTNLIKDPTCFKNPLNPSSIDLILTNRPKRFIGNTVIETGLSDHHKMIITVLKTSLPKQTPNIIRYRDYKHFSLIQFRNELFANLNNMNEKDTNYERFESIFVELINQHAPMKIKYVRANNAPFMNKLLSKAVMTRTRLRNRFLKHPSEINRKNYKKYRNFCVRLFKKEKKMFYNKLNTRDITDNKKFWKTVKPLFSEKYSSRNKITLLEGNNIISKDEEVAETKNTFFSNVGKELDIKVCSKDKSHCNPDLDHISNIITKFKDHPSILKIKGMIDITNPFSLSKINELVVSTYIKSLDINKPTTFNNIPVRFLVENNDIVSLFITNIYNDSLSNLDYPTLLKVADITPVHKKDDTTKKDNYRPVNILPVISKIFERIIFDQISSLYTAFYLYFYLVFVKDLAHNIAW